MSTRTKPHTKPKSRRGGVNLGLVASLAVFAVAVLAVAFLGGSDEPATLGTVTAPTTAADAGTIGGLPATGEVSAMGVPVVEVPGSASGAVSAGGVTVEGADWTMGQVPLDVAVRPYWTLTNTGGAPVTLGEPQAEVREGCCPGSFAIDASTLEPGESATMTFELAMHEGMDGWHDMGVYVPVENDSEEAVLALSVTGDFRN